LCALHGGLPRHTILAELVVRHLGTTTLGEGRQSSTPWAEASAKNPSGAHSSTSLARIVTDGKKAAAIEG
jgi:hypothetical protein